MLTIPTNPDLTILVIAFNEEDGLPMTIKDLIEAQERLGFRARILILDDGSTDRTAAIADELVGRHEQVDVFHHPKNVGQFKNIMKGIELTDTGSFTLIAGDGQIDVSRFDLFLAFMGTHDVIFGFPNNEYVRGTLRTFLSHAWRLYLLVLYGISVTYLAGWIVAPTELVRRIPVRNGGFLGWYEMAVKLVLCGASYMQVPFEMRPRQGGQTKALRPSRNFTDLLRMLNIWRRSKGPGVLPEGRDFQGLRQIYVDYCSDQKKPNEKSEQGFESDRPQIPAVAIHD